MVPFRPAIQATSRIPDRGVDMRSRVIAGTPRRQMADGTLLLYVRTVEENYFGRCCAVVE